MNELTSSLQSECDRRITNLHKQSHTWLLQVAYNICKSFTEAEELVSDLYVYLVKHCRPHIWWGESYNLIYCQKFLLHRWYNRVEKVKRYYHTQNPIESETPDTEYDVERDMEIQKAHEEVVEELKRLQITRLWAPAKIFEIYWMSDRTLDQVAKEIGISRSTVFLSIKKIRNYLKLSIQNPFNETESTYE